MTQLQEDSSSSSSSSSTDAPSTTAIPPAESSSLSAASSLLPDTLHPMSPPPHEVESSLESRLDEEEEASHGNLKSERVTGVIGADDGNHDDATTRREDSSPSSGTSSVPAANSLDAKNNIDNNNNNNNNKFKSLESASHHNDSIPIIVEIQDSASQNGDIDDNDLNDDINANNHMETTPQVEDDKLHQNRNEHHPMEENATIIPIIKVTNSHESTNGEAASIVGINSSAAANTVPVVPESKENEDTASSGVLRLRNGSITKLEPSEKTSTPSFPSKSTAAEIPTKASVSDTPIRIPLAVIDPNPTTVHQQSGENSPSSNNHTSFLHPFHKFKFFEHRIFTSKHSKSNLISLLFTVCLWPLKFALLLAIVILQGQLLFERGKEVRCAGENSSQLRFQYSSQESELMTLFWILALMRLIFIFVSPLLPFIRLFSYLKLSLTFVWMVVEFVYHAFEYTLIFFYIGAGAMLWEYVTCSQRDSIMILYFIDLAVILVLGTIRWSIVWFLCCLEGSNEPVLERKELTEVAPEVWRADAEYEQSTGHPSYPLRTSVPKRSDQDAGLNLLEGDHKYLDKKSDQEEDKHRAASPEDEERTSPHSVVHENDSTKEGAPAVGHFMENAEDVESEEEKREEDAAPSTLNLDEDVSEENREEMAEDAARHASSDDTIVDTVENHDASKSKAYAEQASSS